MTQKTPRKNIFEFLYVGVAYAWHDFYRHYIQYEVDKIMGKYPTPWSRRVMDQVRVMLYIKNNYKKISDKDVLHKCEGIPYVDTKMFLDYLKSQKSADMGPWYLRGFEWKKYQKKHGR